MDVLVARCAALDVDKKTVTACVRGQRPTALIRTFDTFLGR